jgi:hypothetical protein
VRALPLIMILATAVRGADAQQPSATDCTSSERCRALTLEAIERRDYEGAHDFAWRTIQTSPKRDRDTAAMSLLARAQSLSGRGYDALIMLQRLADAGVIVDDADTSDDFRRVRDYPEWPQLLDTMNSIRVAAGNRAATGAKATTDARLAPRKDRRATYAGFATPVAAVAPVTPVLLLPTSIGSPVALAYDAVSARFILAGADSDLLHVVSETSGNAMNLVASGWSGGSPIAAVTIDRRTGNLWVAGGGSVFRLQLISGRLLEKFAVAEDAGETAFVALVAAADGVFALDAAQRRIFSIAPARKTLRVFATLPRDVMPTGLASSGPSLYISHSAGLLRIGSASRSARPVAANRVDVSNLHSLAWHKGALLAIQRKDAAMTVRVTLNASGTTATALDVLGPAAGSAASLSGDAYYFLANATDTGLAFRSVPAGK